ncbi:hypothetical protein P171DRAFT_520590 [Karstenula rhodostoma CBS 690.94]|uniref:F-box domain-containing protein n=1 Tax=Karstenula rhodostoma CBS 690.94 TaxID=1392251 RepID=A0A9P4UD70_9PLEO|nr:hypothetical protein P171DRAFT_520590 [Karstenula rhodostoma CBS 690.94]
MFSLDWPLSSSFTGPPDSSAMNSLPQELVDNISEHLNRDDLKNTLLLSRPFQYAAERFSGAFSTYALNEGNVEDFLRVYGGQRFYRYLREVELKTSVPALDGDPDECRDSAAELRKMDESFTRQIKFLFSAINIELVIYTPTIAIARGRYCVHRTFSSWRIHLLSPDSLPNLESVRSLCVELGASTSYDLEPDTPMRKLDLRVLLDLAEKLPILNLLKCNIGGDEWMQGTSSEDAHYLWQDWAGPRQDSRRDFVQAFNSIAPALQKLRHVRLDFIYPLEDVDYTDQRLAMPDLTHPSKHDAFSTSLRLLSHQLRTMTLRVIADHTLFWPNDGTIPSWPNLEQLSVMFYIATPSGSWYFRGLHNEGEHEGFEVTTKSYPPLETTDEDEDSELDYEYFNALDYRTEAQCCVVPNDETLGPFLAAFAKAAALMPALKQAALWAPLNFLVDWEQYEDFDANQVSKYHEDKLTWGIRWVRPYTEAFSGYPSEDFSAVRHMWWHVAKWRPDAALLDLFHGIGRKEHGTDVTMYWEDSWCESGLVSRDCFDSWESQVFR